MESTGKVAWTLMAVDFLPIARPHLGSGSVGLTVYDSLTAVTTTKGLIDSRSRLVRYMRIIRTIQNMYQDIRNEMFEDLS